MNIQTITELCRYLSIRPDGKYVAMSDYYGTLDELHVTVVLRQDGFRSGAYTLNRDVKCNNETELKQIADQLQGYCDE